jgi:hypothetical protein
MEGGGVDAVGTGLTTVLGAGELEGGGGSELGPGVPGAGVTWTPQAASPAATEPATIARSSARREIVRSLVTLAR